MSSSSIASMPMSSPGSMPMSSSTSDSTMMSMSTMQITFFTSTTTPLYSTYWMPSTTAQYAGTCIFLIILAVIFRALFGVRAVQERKWELAESRRRYVIAGADEKEKVCSRVSEDKAEVGSFSEKSTDSSAAGFKRKTRGVRPWRISQDSLRACLDIVIAGVGYLLMLAAMTMNVGYFLSILGGTFVGTLVAGPFSPLTSH